MISLPQPTKVVESKNNRGVFVIEGLYPGYGITIGNSLRRVLLSSLGGAAVTEANIKGAEHEFSTLSGVQEDVISILLNLKQMRFRMHEDAPQNAKLKIKGEKQLKASDFELPATLELLNGDLPIAAITDKNTELEIEIQVEKGVGYVPAEERKREKQEIGSIALDAIFTPVKRVSSKVENMRVGDRTDFNRLEIEVETDGTVSPEEAFYQATAILQKQFEAVMAGVKDNAKEKMKAEEKSAEKESGKTAKKKTAAKKTAKKKK